MKLNKAKVEGLKLPEGKSERIVFDDALKGFGVRLRAGGKRTWIAQYRFGSKQRRLTLGTLENTDFDEARKRAKKALSNTYLGKDPALEKVEARAQAGVTLSSVAERYLSERAAKRLKPRSLEEVERHLRKHWAPLGELPLKKIDRATVAAQLGKIAKDSGPFAANRARAALSAMFSWAIGEGLADANPIVGTNKATEEISRDRVLSDDELRLVWLHAGAGEYGAIARLLILTGQRREEVGAMEWGEIDLDAAVWTIPAPRTKNKRPHDVPLSPAAVEILRTLPRRADREYVFGSGSGGFQGWSHCKSALDARIAEAGGKVKPWRLHDLRRTLATRLGDMSVLPHVVEATLNHVSGHRAGVAGVYNRAVYATEKRDALGPVIISEGDPHMTFQIPKIDFA